MKLEHVEKTEAVMVAAARLTEDVFSAKVTASCEYASQELPGATCSAEVDVPAEHLKAIKDAMTAATIAVSAELGRRLTRAKAEAFRTSVVQGEIK